MKNNANIILDLGQKSIRFEETLDFKSKIFEQSLVEMEQKMVRNTGRNTCSIEKRHLIQAN